jgi:hypothetical protein
MSIEYWTTFTYSHEDDVCSKHRTLRAAQRAADRCEARGGDKHRIFKVERMPRSGKIDKDK